MSGARNRQRQWAAAEPSAKQIDELATRAETSGCDRCGIRFAELLPYYMCRTTGGGFSVRCADCSRIAAEPVLLAAFHNTGGDPWSKDDRDWFAAHPNRRWRLRDPWRGEAAALAIGDPSIDVEMFRTDAARRGLRMAVAIVKVAIGKRLRSVVAIATSDPFDSFTDAGIIRLVPGLDDRMTQIAGASDAEWERMSAQKLADRLRVTAAVVRGRTP
jgi:hypothetical protein